VSADFTHAVLAFGTNLRDEYGFTGAQGKGHDALRAAEVVGIVDRDRLRHALRVIYCSSPDEVRHFDDAFDRFFRGPEGIAQPDAPARRTRPGPDRAGDDAPAPRPHAKDERTPDDDAGGDARGEGRPADGFPDAAAEWQMLRARYSPHAAHAEPPVISGEGLDALLAATGTLIASLRRGRSRRWKPARNGPRFDLRRTLRGGVNTGGEPFALHRLGPPRHNPRFVVLIDGSRSMADDAGPSLQFAHALLRRTRRAHAFVFSTAMREVTGALRDRRQTGRALSDLGEAWGGGTRLGANLAAFVRGPGRVLLRPDTVVLIVSDGLDSGDTAGLERAMRTLHRRSTVVWLHPRAGTLDFHPSASGMRAALPSVDLLAAAGDRADMIRLARTMARRVRR
jgi:uncharacterized protein with von Willebrand factor type A (vWA) domain